MSKKEREYLIQFYYSPSAYVTAQLTFSSSKKLHNYLNSKFIRFTVGDRTHYIINKSKIIFIEIEEIKKKDE